ncbi:hypothetical protein B296_00033840 [Ensete ventricosum]|uniref:Uncharacterized protein n=1 Tax=Ensete ventricosum TaxID=4639 RepID=A0A426ZB56_ENSVE|nr:hypothetical protein B296_00033840 [Ensete ventricosum]
MSNRTQHYRLDSNTKKHDSYKEQLNPRVVSSPLKPSHSSLPLSIEPSAISRSFSISVLIHLRDRGSPFQEVEDLHSKRRIQLCPSPAISFFFSFYLPRISF